MGKPVPAAKTSGRYRPLPWKHLYQLGNSSVAYWYGKDGVQKRRGLMNSMRKCNEWLERMHVPVGLHVVVILNVHPVLCILFAGAKLELL